MRKGQHGLTCRQRSEPGRPSRDHKPRREGLPLALHWPGPSISFINLASLHADISPQPSIEFALANMAIDGLPADELLTVFGVYVISHNVISLFKSIS